MWFALRGLFAHRRCHVSIIHTSSSSLSQDQPFQSFWMGGYEGADHVNGRGEALDNVRSSGHLDNLDDDYAAATELGIRIVRESIGWRLAEPARGRYDLERTVRIARAARRHGIQVLWSLMHYGTPSDVDLFDDALIDRFAAYAAAVADRLAPLHDAPPVYTPINEIGFLSWVVSSSADMSPYRPPESGRGSEISGYAVKCRLVRAALAAMAAMRRVDPRCRFLHVEPVVHVVAPRERPDLDALAAEVCEYQWQAWDLLAGRLDPQLGGHAEALDLIGANYYASGQWEVHTERRLSWDPRDPRRRPLADLLDALWQRYRRPLILSETSHAGDARAPWLHEVAGEVQRARGHGVPVHGLCLYPLIDRVDWNRTDQWHHSGLWDVSDPPRETPPRERRLCADYAATLAQWQRVLPSAPHEGQR